MSSVINEAGKPLFGAHLFRKGPPDLRCDVRHEVAPNLPAFIGDLVVKQKTWRLDRAGAEEDRLAPLPDIFALVTINKRGDLAALVALECMDEAFRADLCT